MGIVKKIKEIIFKIKDYDRLERDYIKTLEYATGNVLSKPNYDINSVYEAIENNWKEIEKQVEQPSMQIQKILNSIGKDATWCVMSILPNGRTTHFFRGGYKIKEEDLSERERDHFYSWCHAVLWNAECEAKRKK